jgi:hypothetical protein
MHITVFRRSRSCEMWSYVVRRVFHHCYAFIFNVKQFQACAAGTVITCRFAVAFPSMLHSIPIMLIYLSCVHTIWPSTVLQSTVYQLAGRLLFLFRANKGNKLDLTRCYVKTDHTPDTVQWTKNIWQCTRTAPSGIWYPRRDIFCSNPNLRSMKLSH